LPLIIIYNKYFSTIQTQTSFLGQYNAASLCNILGARNLGAAVKRGGGKIIVQVPFKLILANQILF
jgi:hypothetical protein